MYTKTLRAALPPLKKLSVPAWQQLAANQARWDDGDLPEDADRPESECKVKMDRMYSTAARPDEDVPPPDRLKAYRYGKELVPFGVDDMETLKYSSGDKHLRVIGFLGRGRVRRHWHMAGVDCVVAQPGNPGAQRALSALIRALHASGPL